MLNKLTSLGQNLIKAPIISADSFIQWTFIINQGLNPLVQGIAISLNKEIPDDTRRFLALQEFSEGVTRLAVNAGVIMSFKKLAYEPHLSTMIQGGFKNILTNSAEAIKKSVPELAKKIMSNGTLDQKKVTALAKKLEGNTGTILNTFLMPGLSLIVITPFIKNKLATFINNRNAKNNPDAPKLDTGSTNHFLHDNKIAVYAHQLSDVRGGMPTPPAVNPAFATAKPSMLNITAQSLKAPY